MGSIVGAGLERGAENYNREKHFICCNFQQQRNDETLLIVPRLIMNNPNFLAL